MNVEVGILSSPCIRYEIPAEGSRIRTATPESFPEGRIRGPFILHDVVIGLQFHWERKMTQTFGGELEFRRDGDNLVAVNIIGVEEYLLSVVSSEMNASADLEFLKAHAVISRSWLMAQIRKRRDGRLCRSAEAGEAGGGQYIRWFDHEDHSLFDVCADDHCQRYQGMQMAVGENVLKAIDSTAGQVLTYGGSICDARFSKCCGGRTERFSACWEDRDYDYLVPVDDPFCDTRDQRVLSKVLNGYDLETDDFHDWSVRYPADELSDLVRRRSGIDFGTITALEPLERGESGRIVRLRIVGTEKTMVIGKELVIRRFLSESHLKSSAFEVRREGNDFILEGHGWGHGVGLCQIGAAVMADRGYDYRQILAYYYPGAKIQ